MTDPIEQLAQAGDSLWLASLMGATHDDELLADGPSQTVPPVKALREGPGSVIGRYKLLEQIGEGGFGVVFMAEQREPVRRMVALKIIKLGMDTRQVVARFEAERQALAMMDHPHIAKVHDAGATDTGRPYFVMELVRGVPITTFCDENKLTTKERLELFVPVCSAIQHAHHKGIIHRDLKPGNVLVTMHDDKSVPMVIDFGVAKATQGRLTEKTLFTEFRQLIGTPAYMSPEQAQLSGLDVDTRSDIYSLGVLLYELLAGTTPFDPKELRSAAHEEMRRIIREVEPPTPSTRLSTLAAGTRSSVADRRKCDPKTLSRTLKGELDWIIMKCLEKDRARRYETANGLARDIERYLADEAVEASPPSAAYKLRKLAHKHRVALRFAAALLLMLVAATIVSSWQAIRATRARASESAQRWQAEAVARLLESVFKRLDPTAAQKGGDDLKTQIVAQLDRAAADLDKADYSADPLTRARLRSALGNTEVGLGETKKGEALLQAALNEQIFFGGPDDLQTLITMTSVAHAWDQVGRYTEAITLFEQVRDRSIRTLGPDDRTTLNTLDSLAVAYSHAGRYPEATALLQQVRDRKSKALGADDPDTLIALNNLGAAYLSAERLTDAINTFEAARDREIKALGPADAETLTTLNNLGLAYDYTGRVADAIALDEQVRDREINKLGPDHPKTLATINNLANAYQNAGRIEEALALLEDLRDRSLKSAGPDDPHTLIAMHNLADTYKAAGRIPDAIALYEQVRQRQIKKLGADHPNALITQEHLAELYQRQAQYAQAEPLWLALGNWSLAHPQGLPAYGITAGKVLPQLIACYQQLAEPAKAQEWTRKLAAAAPQAKQQKD